MVITRADIVEEAMSWRGTPFGWQASIKGVACDCKGLIVGVARQLGLPQADSPWALIRNYRKVDDRLVTGIEAEFDNVPRETMAPGDVLILRLGRKPMHLAILGHGRIIHSYTNMVVSATDIDAAFRLWPFHSAWAWRGVE